MDDSSLFWAHGTARRRRRRRRRGCFTSLACARPPLSDRDKVCNGRRATALPPPCTGTHGGRWARAWRKTKRCHAHPIAQPGGEHLPRQSTPIMCVQPGSVRVVCTRVRARVEPGATTGAREYTGSSSLTFPAPAHNHAELSGGNRHSAHRGAKRADVLGVTHRLPPLALDLRRRRSLGLGPKAVAGQRGQPHSARRRRVVKKKRTKMLFFSLHIARGKRRPVAGVGGTKISWGRGTKCFPSILPLGSRTAKPRVG